jgi:hypothetical protein
LISKGKLLKKGVTITGRFIYLDDIPKGSYSGKLY